MELHGRVVKLPLKSQRKRKVESRLSRCAETCAMLDTLYSEGKITAEEAMEKRALMRATVCY